MTLNMTFGPLISKKEQVDAIFDESMSNTQSTSGLAGNAIKSEMAVFEISDMRNWSLELVYN